MEKINFKDYPDLTTPVNSENLNSLQDNTEEAINDAVDLINQDLILKLNHKVLSPEATYVYNFNGNVFASSNITINNKISDNKTITVNFGDGIFDNIEMDATSLMTASFRKKIFLKDIQSYVEVSRVNDNTLKVFLEHVSAIGGTKNIKIKITSLI